MLIHDRFVFLEVRKTACTFIVDALKKELPAGSFQLATKHGGWNEIPASVRDRPVLAYVRNPWDWYVSWYHFYKTYEGAPIPPIFRKLSEGDRLDFAATVTNACTIFPAHMGCDLYSFLLKMSMGRGLESGHHLTVGRFESLFDDLEAFLTAVEAPLTADAYKRIRAMEPRNASDHGPYRGYYDDKLREMVGLSATPLITRFEYEF
jgi:hypothetical protein